jgi:hypothetical protein
MVALHVIGLTVIRSLNNLHEFEGLKSKSLSTYSRWYIRENTHLVSPTFGTFKSACH